MKVAVIGGGAAGFFAAIAAASHHPAARIVVFEKSDKLLAKVKISGGGRCNVTHHCFSASGLSKHYPRGGRQLKKAFAAFDAADTVAWFAARGVPLKTEADGRMFPTTDSSQTIIDCLLAEAHARGVEIRMRTPVRTLSRDLQVNGEPFDKVIVATGGSPKASGFAWLEALGHSIEPPVPSLFTFNMPGAPIRSLMGASVSDAVVRIQGTKLQEKGPVLITHWGLSGPAVLKLSAWGARQLADRGYHFAVQVSWAGDTNAEAVGQVLAEAAESGRQRKVANGCPFEAVPRKIWLYLLEKAGINPDQTWLSTAKKSRNKLLELLVNDVHEVRGKTTFKEEFVTCGGVRLSEVDFATMGSRIVPGLHFAGEVLDIDGVTGGFNFQAAWTTGFLAGR